VKERGKEGYFFEFGPGFGCGVYSVWGCLVRLRVIVARGVNSFFNTEDPSAVRYSTVTVERTLRAQPERARSSDKRKTATTSCIGGFFLFFSFFLSFSFSLSLFF